MIDIVIKWAVPAFLTFVCGWLGLQAKKQKALMSGIQAVLRAEMIKDFNKYSEKGYAPLYARQNFENMWAQYHALGANGVMDDIHEKFLELPVREEVQKG